MPDWLREMIQSSVVKAFLERGEPQPETSQAPFQGREWLLKMPQTFSFSLSRQAYCYFIILLLFNNALSETFSLSS
jgi:hypothetical protein